MNTVRNFLLGLATIVCLSIAYYFLIALPAHNRGILQLEREKFEAAQKAKAEEEFEKKKKEDYEKMEAEGKDYFLGSCLQVAEETYTNYIKLNGTPVPGKPDIYDAPMRIWDTAQKNRKDAYDECYRKWGRR
jgi:hypothetical protein